ncbi:MAG: M24 family metallopeptidase [Granulosicoccus sp.]
MSERYQHLRAVARAAGVQSLALVPGANFSRLFNAEFHQNERPLVVVIPVEGLPMAIVPNLELASFEQLGFEGEVYDWKDQNGYQSAFDALMQSSALESIGVEGQVMRVFVDQAFRKASSSVHVVDLQQEISALRITKTDAEVSAISKAVKISEQALQNTIDNIRIGMTERQIENMLVQELFASGAQDFAFSPIVAAGSNSAQPHAHSREGYQLCAGDALLIDFGARVDGVCADITRTFFVRHCTDRQAAMYATVLEANLAAHKASKPGASAHQVDDAATAVLELSDYADFIRHKTGHGLGRDIHEDPYIMRGNHQPLEAGMVFTIEPGLYDSEELGIRIEDDVLITDSGSRSLTSFDKSLTLIG